MSPSFREPPFACHNLSQGPQWLGPGDEHHLPSFGVPVGVSCCSIPWWGTSLIKHVLYKRYSASVSKSHRKTGGAFGEHLVQPLLRAGLATVSCSEPCLVAFGVSQRMEALQPPKQPVPVLDHPHSEVNHDGNTSKHIHTNPLPILIISNLSRFFSLLFFFF